jgi:4-hydroxyphenylacetate 3-monooxygenase
VWFDGERVRDVTTHPILGRPARTLAELYDMQCAPEYRDVLTYPSPATGQPVSLAFIQPRTVDDLVRRRAMFKTWADHHGGVLGRTPDYLNAIVTGLASARAYFEKNGPEYGDRIVAYYELCRERDLCATHTFVDPQVNRARTQGEQADPDVPLHIVGESREGLVVSGARMLATLAPYADELMVFPSPSRTHPTDAPRYAFAFAVPMAVPGLKFICRESFDAGGPAGDHPLTSRFDEMDAVAVFDEVVVPWDRVFLKGDIGLCNGLFRFTNAFVHAIHQFTTKNLAKAELVQCIREIIADRKLAQTQAAALLRLDQPKVSALVRGRVDGYSLDRLFRFLNALGHDVARPT